MEDLGLRLSEGTKTTVSRTCSSRLTSTRQWQRYPFLRVLVANHLAYRFTYCQKEHLTFV